MHRNVRKWPFLGMSYGSVWQKQHNLIGLVSAYIPNRASGEVLPGVCMVRAIFPYHDFIGRLESFEEARAKEQELAAQQTIESPGTLPAPPPVNDHQQTEEPPTN
jgi:hypothetical protein